MGSHFITFVNGEDWRLWVLNGAMKGPVDCGLLGDGEDSLSDRALELGVKSFLKEGGEDNYLVALAPKVEEYHFGLHDQFCLIYLASLPTPSSPDP